MCGVIGYYSATPKRRDWEVIAALLRESSVRGLHAFGLAIPDGKGGAVARELKIEDLITVGQRLFDDLRPSQLIAHARYSTSGDWRSVENNQPLVVSGDALVFNGVIDMRTKAQMETAWGISMTTGNDGEIFLQHAASGGSAVDFLLNNPCSFAGCYLLSGQMFCLRNDKRPLWYAVRGDATFVMSTRNISERCGLSPIELPAFEEFRVDRLRELLPCAAKSQQAGRLYSVPPSYASSRRYRPRIASNDVPGESL